VLTGPPLVAQPFRAANGGQCIFGDARRGLSHPPPTRRRDVAVARYGQTPATRLLTSMLPGQMLKTAATLSFRMLPAPAPVIQMARL
jgi:hypothetical protein